MNSRNMKNENKSEVILTSREFSTANFIFYETKNPLPLYLSPKENSDVGRKELLSKHQPTIRGT